MALTALPALDIKAKCRKLLVRPGDMSKWEAPGLPDAQGGEWPAAVCTILAGIIAGLVMPQFKEDRMPLARALSRLDDALAHADDAAVAASYRQALLEQTEAMNSADEPRECVVCMAAPRSVRFTCGHAVCCESCAFSLLRAGHPCPTCRGVVEMLPTSSAVGSQPTYVQQRRPAAGQQATPPVQEDAAGSTSAVPVASGTPDAVGRGRRNRRRPPNRGAGGAGSSSAPSPAPGR